MTAPDHPLFSPLNRLHQELLDRDLVTQYCAPEEHGQAEAIYVSLGVDEGGEPLLAQIFVLNDLLALSGLRGDDDMVMLMVQVLLRYDVAADAAAAIEGALNLVNQLSPLGIFAFFAEEEAIVQHYTLAMADRRFDGDLLFEVLAAMRHFLLEIIAPLGLVASGQWDAAAFARHLREDLGLVLPADLRPAPREDGGAT